MARRRTSTLGVVCLVLPPLICAPPTGGATIRSSDKGFDVNRSSHYRPAHESLRHRAAVPLQRHRRDGDNDGTDGHASSLLSSLDSVLERNNFETRGVVKTDDVDDSDIAAASGSVDKEVDRLEEQRSEDGIPAATSSSSSLRIQTTHRSHDNVNENGHSPVSDTNAMRNLRSRQSRSSSTEQWCK